MRKGFFGSIAALLASTGMAMADGPAPAPAAATSGPSCATPVIAAPGYDGGADNGRFWASGEYLLWWFKNSPVDTPLITTGTIGAPGTTILLGGTSINSDEHNGARFTVGGWADCDHTIGGEVSGFFFAGKSTTSSAFSGTGAAAASFGVPFTAEPAGTPSFLALNTPGVSSATATESLHQNLWGWSANGLLGIGDNCREGLHLSLLGGFRYVDFDEDFGFSTATTAFPAIGLPISTTDQINSQNRFYGGNGGIRAEYSCGPWFFSATGQLAMGWTHESIGYGAETIATIGGAPIVTTGTGILVGPTNVGRSSHNQFSILPESTLNAGVNVTDWATLFVGYDFLYLSNVVRPGSEIDTGFGGVRPIPMLHSTDFWAQGINFGVALHF